MHTLQAFPSQTAFATELPERLLRENYALRLASESDLVFLRELYASLRAEELALVAWTTEAKTAFLDSQFALQHRHFLHYFADAEFLILEHNGEPVGRLYVSRQTQDWLIIDIGLIPAHRSKGVGTALFLQLLAAAEYAGAHSVALHVEQRNVRAHKLYRKLGFRDVSVEGFHQLMRWNTSMRAAQLNTAS